MSASDVIALSGVLVSGVSACASIVTLYFAKSALNTWKAQEILKTKKDFKLALLEMKFVVLWLPESIDVDHLMVGRRLLYGADEELKAPLLNKQVKAFEGYALEFEKFEDAMQKCARMWFASESLFKGNQVELLWKGIFEAYNEYSQGRQNQSFFIKKLDELLVVDMYFEANVKS
ncbi:hypothetical protein [Enterobacter mori]|uniref:hypothetical protein n=1 Tax=Enterobacter mori TaxID=539813 RepID=UPI001BDFC9FD|nr:hypothetical protein [Enterobacter mori]MBT1882564.1 hypothetical protein [Enterobacter mori]MCW4856384.1 hypothetical protein [Enterobacter mori]